MATQLIEHPAEVRCYECGKPAIVGICHHCGRPVCKDHGRQPKSTTSGPATLEFTELGLAETKWGEIPMHCVEHDHVVIKPALQTLMWGVAIVAIGFIVAALQIAQNKGNPLVGLVMVLIGAGIAGLGYLNYTRTGSANAGQRPALPVLPQLEATRVRETLAANIVLNEAGEYLMATAAATGSLRISANFSRSERERLEKYLKKFKLPDARGLQFQAGFALLKGPAGLVLRNGSQKGGDGHIIRLTGPVESQPILSGAGGRGAGEWGLTQEYRLLPSAGDPDPSHFPVHLAPSLAPDSARRTLDLELLWSSPATDDRELPLQRIELLELHVPATWGFPVTKPDSTVSTAAGGGQNEQGDRIITWRRVDVADFEKIHRRKTFMLQFENPIETVDTISGRVEVVFQGALSQLHSVEMFTPLGLPRADDKTEIETRVEANFQLALASLRDQDTRVVPDSKSEKDSGREGTMAFPGVIPDHVTVIELTNAISGTGYYVKRVIESPPRTGDRANTVNRYWDIAGRKYFGVYPIDFHLVLSGEAVYGGEIRAIAGATKTALTVQGVCSNPQMEADIEGVWDQLTELIKATLAPLAKKPAAPPKPEEPREVVADPINKAPAVSDKDGQRAKLEQRRDQLMDALLAGRITESMYQKLLDGVEASLSALNQPA